MEHSVTKLFVMCGIPASGKTTLSRQLAKQYNMKLYCYDELPKANTYLKDEVHAKMFYNIAEDLRNGYSVVVDDLHTKLKWRNGILSAVGDIPCKKTLIVMKTPLEECLVRNTHRQRRLPDFVITNLYQSYEPPSLAEGWDEIITI